MARSIVAVIVGYVAMFGVIFLSFTAAYLAMGPERAFRPGSYQVTGLWLAVSVALGLVAGLLGGLVCAWIARRRGAVLGLMGLVAVLGLAIAGAEATHVPAPGEPNGVSAARTRGR